MAYDDRKKLIEGIEKLRNGRKLIAFCNFDRQSVPELHGLTVPFSSDAKESLYRVLKETNIGKKGIDLFLYTRGGDTNAVWPIVSILREFDPEFEVLVPFRIHSAGTMVALASKRIVMTRIAELSPIDPSTGNQFNPPDPLNKGKLLGISVEDVNAYKDFIKEALGLDAENKKQTSQERDVLQPFMQKLISDVHPIAIGNVHRVHKLIQRLARNLLKCNKISRRDESEIIKKLIVEPYSHLHMINRHEAKEILGNKQVVFADGKLEAALDSMLREYENTFDLRKPLFLPRLMKDKIENEVRFVGGAVESAKWGYLFVTSAKITKFSELPPNVAVQLPPGQAMPLVPGVPVKYNVEIYGQAWEHNKEPQGVTV